jgi:beta-lactamase class A
MRRLFLVAILCSLSWTTAGQQKAALQQVLEAEVSRFPATVGVYVKHLSTGEEAGVRDRERFNSMSIIKIPIMMKAYQMADRGELDLGERMVFTRGDIRSGGGILKFLTPGTTVTVRDLITYMTIVSDNSAAEIMIDRVGGRLALNNWLMESGYTSTRIASLSPFRADFDRAVPDWKNLSTEEVMGLQFAAWNDPLFELYRPLFLGEREKWIERRKDPQIQARIADEYRRDPEGWGSMNPRETARMLEAIEQGTTASARASAEMKLVLRRQVLGARGLPHFLSVPVGHKTGADPGIVHDVGLLYARSGPIVFAFFSAEVREPRREFEDRIGRLAKVVVDYFDGSR